MKRRHLLMLCSLCVLAPTAAAEVDVSGSVFTTVGKAKGIDPLLLYSVALAESAFHKKGIKTVKPWQFALRTSSSAYYGKCYEDTVKELRRILKTTDSVDVGIMQINVRWHKHRVRKPEDLIDLQTNVSVAADILRERLAANDDDWTQALAQYHSFTPARGAWYSAFVLGIYMQISNSASAKKGKAPLLAW